MEKYLITGGAGFIGCNIASRLIEQKKSVVIFDNLSRKGAQLNLKWLRTHGKFEFVHGDIRNSDEMTCLFQHHPDIDVVYHEASQVAVTTSVQSPRIDFEINAIGTFNLLEAIRTTQLDPILIFASTNKVYGGLEHLKIVERNGRYEYAELPYGVSEETVLDFHSPYGCSKGAADQYVRDYARIYGLRTVVFRQSCIYGYRQFGVEDQGWVAWFTIAATQGWPLTIYGDGRQVRDVLFIDDLVDAYLMATENINVCAGQIYNIGGGSQNTLSLLELISLLEELLGRKVKYSFDKWRPGDQKVFVCDIRKAQTDFGWQPKVKPKEGVGNLLRWVLQNTELFEAWS